MNTPSLRNRNSQRAASHPMSLEVARRVPWLRSRPRPLGELMDEGYLNASRLEWAAKNAYDPALKEAARVLLDWQSNSASPSIGQKQTPAQPSAAPPAPFPLAISLEKARSTKWPFGPLRGQLMGELSETRQVTLKDLGNLIDTAWDERVRQAAIALLLVRLDQVLREPPPPAGTVKVIQGGRSYSVHRQFTLTFLQGGIAGAVFVFGLWLFIGSLIKELTAHPSKGMPATLSLPYGPVALVLALFLAAGIVWLGLLLFDRAMKILDKRIDNYRTGEEREDKVVEKVRQVLDGEWVLFRNVVLPGRRRADLDIVLVGPAGVWALEVKTLKGEFRNIGETWEWRAGKRWKPVARNPSRQAKKGAVALKQFLMADGIKTYVPEAVVWANEETNLAVDNPTVAVWTMDRLQDELGNLWHGERIPEPAREQVVEKLTRLCEAQRKTKKRSGPGQAPGECTHRHPCNLSLQCTDPLSPDRYTDQRARRTKLHVDEPGGPLRSEAAALNHRDRSAPR